MRVVAEVFFLRVRPDGVGLVGGDGDGDGDGQMSTLTTLVADSDPSRVAREVAMQSHAEQDFIHSTSWRFVDSSVILTFAAGLTNPSKGDPLDSDLIPHYDLVLDSPQDPKTLDVASHAVRHLAFLNRRGTLIVDHQWQAALGSYPDGIAGEFS